MYDATKIYGLLRAVFQFSLFHCRDCKRLHSIHSLPILHWTLALLWKLLLPTSRSQSSTGSLSGICFGTSSSPISTFVISTGRWLLRLLRLSFSASVAARLFLPWDAVSTLVGFFGVDRRSWAAGFVDLWLLRGFTGGWDSLWSRLLDDATDFWLFWLLWLLNEILSGSLSPNSDTFNWDLPPSYLNQKREIITKLNSSWNYMQAKVFTFK